MKEISRVKAASLILSLAICVAVPSCRSIKRCDVVDEEAACMAVGPDMLNTRIELVGQSDLHPSNTIWMDEGGALVAVWDTHTFFLSFSEVACDFSNFTEATEDCWVCDLCDVSPASQQRCPYIDVFAFVTNNSPTVVFHDWFMPEAESTTILTLDPTSGCSARGSAPVPFTPANNGTYQVLTPEVNSSYPSRLTLVDTKVFVIQNGMTQTTSYALTKYASDPSRGKEWYMWTVQGNPVWEDNFSQNVRIGQLRVLTGSPGTDPSTGRFWLEDAKVVRPSRILFFSNFIAIDTSNGNLSDGSDILTHAFENDNRCYVDRNKEDGDINLVGIPMMRTRCRQNSPGQTARENDFAATPTYLILEPGTQLTWFVEFYEQEGADFDPTTSGFDPIPANAILAIEFTIESVP